MQTMELSTLDLNIRMFDSYSFISSIMDNYESYGFENLDSCWDTVSGATIKVLCPDITKRMFCDEAHLTSKMQAMLAEEFHRFMVEASNVIIGKPSTSNREALMNIILFIFALICAHLSR